MGSSASISTMSKSSNDSSIGCMEGEGFVKVGRYGAGNGGSRFGVRVGGERCQLCYFVVFGPRLRERAWRGSNGTSSCGNKASIRTWSMGRLYRHR